MTAKKKILADHQQVGKKFYPPAARFGWTEIHYIERIIPEIAWIGYFLKCLGTRPGITAVTELIETCYSIRRLNRAPELTLLSCYRALITADWEELRKRLKSKDIYLQCLNCITPFVRCYPTDNPLVNLFEEPLHAGFFEADVEAARRVVSDLFDRRSKQASIIQSVVFSVGLKLGKHHVPQDYPFTDFSVLIDDFESQKANDTAAHVRMHANQIYQFHESKIGDSWARYFWNRGKELAPLNPGNKEVRPPTEKSRHPIVQFGIDYEQYVWELVDDIWPKLPIDICDSELFEVIGALLARQACLAVKIANNIDLWDYHAGPLFLRAMTDCYITAAWILKDPIDRARKFILYGLGQEKLEIERLKLVLPDQSPEDRQHVEERIRIQEAWLNAQHYSFLQHVDVGSWSGKSTRKMAEEADCLDLYDFAYTGWSHGAHSTWNHIGKFDIWPAAEPLHKHINQPANFEHGHHMDVVELASKYFDKLSVLIVNHFKLEMTMPNPNAWFNKRAQEFSAELAKFHKDDPRVDIVWE